MQRLERRSRLLSWQKRYSQMLRTDLRLRRLSINCAAASSSRIAGKRRFAIYGQIKFVAGINSNRAANPGFSRVVGECKGFSVQRCVSRGVNRAAFTIAGIPGKGVNAVARLVVASLPEGYGS